MRVDLDAGEKKIMGKEMVKLRKKAGNLQDQIVDLTEKLTNANHQIRTESRMSEREKGEEGENGEDEKDGMSETGGIEEKGRRSRPSSARSIHSSPIQGK
jgi:hypothetical protein